MSDPVSSSATPTMEMAERFRRKGSNGSFVEAVAAKVIWPTPTMADGLGGPGNSGRDGGENLRTRVGGQLNPTWVEWLMGFPLGWTDCEPSATP
jgi:hypothetical protein